MKNNEGTSRIQVLTAILVMVVVIGGCYFALRYVASNYGSDEDATQCMASAENQAETICKKVATIAEAADVDFDFNYATGSCVAVSTRGYTILTVAEKKLFIYEQSFDCELTDDEKIEAANAMAGRKNGSVFSEGVSFFGIDMKTKKDGAVEVNVKVSVKGNDSELNRSINLNPYTVMRAKGIEFEREEVELESVSSEVVTEQNQEENEEINPDENEDRIVDTEVVEKETEEKNEEPTEIKEEIENKEEKIENNEQPKADETAIVSQDGKINLAALKKYPADAEILVTVLCEEEKAKKGWCVGGIGIGSTEVSDNEALQYKLGNAPTAGKIYEVRFAVCDILAEAKANGTDEVNVMFYNGFTVQAIEMIEE